MKKLMIVAVMMAACALPLLASQTITDMAGRTVILPDSDEINKVFTANPVASIFLYTVDPSYIVGWNTNLSKEAKKELREDVVDLKNYGVIYGNGKSANDEEIIKTAPDFILLMGEKNATISAKADEVSARLHIPVVVLYSELENTSKAYKLMGEICGITERTDKLGDFSDRIISRAEALSESIPENDRKSIYYSLDNSGLKTYPAGSRNASLIELCGGKNVITLPNNKKFGTMSISFEELLLHKPEIILAGSYPNREMRDGSIFDENHWALLDAEVSVVPRNPFNIFDKPPSVNRIAGIIWLQKELYPEIAEYDSEKELADFRALFYVIK